MALQGARVLHGHAQQNQVAAGSLSSPGEPSVASAPTAVPSLGPVYLHIPCGVGAACSFGLQ